MDNNGSEIINIRVNILHSRTFFLQVHKQIPIPMLRGHIAMVTSIPAHNQRLLYDGHVLSDERVLSEYNVRDGITLHLVIQQPDHVPFRSMPYQPVSADPARFRGQTSNSFVMGGAVPDGDSELMRRRIILSLITNYVISSNVNPSAPLDVLDAMPRLRREVDVLYRLYQNNGLIILGDNGSAQPQNPNLHVDQTPEFNMTPELLTNLYWVTRPLLNNVLGRMHELALEIQMQRFVSDYMQQWNIQRLASTLGTQLQDVGSFLIELGRITSTLTTNPTNFPTPQQRYSSQPGTSAGTGAMTNTGPGPSNTYNQVRVVPTPDLTTSEDEAANCERSRREEGDPQQSSSDHKQHQKRQEEN